MQDQLRHKVDMAMIIYGSKVEWFFSYLFGILYGMIRGLGVGIVLGLGGCLLTGGLVDPHMQARTHDFFVACAVCAILGGLAGWYFTYRGRQDSFDALIHKLAQIPLDEEDS